MAMGQANPSSGRRGGNAGRRSSPQPPQTNRKKMRRRPILAMAPPLPVLIPRHRQTRHVPPQQRGPLKARRKTPLLFSGLRPPPPRVRHWRSKASAITFRRKPSRRRTPGAGLDPSYVVRRKRWRAKPSANFQGYPFRSRREIHGQGFSAGPVVPRHRTQRFKAAPGSGKRRRLKARSTGAVPFVIMRRKQHRSYVAPSKLGRRRKPMATGSVFAAVQQRHKQTRRPTPLPTGKRRRGRAPGLGQTLQFFVVLKRRKTRPAGPGWVKSKRHWVRPQLFSLVGSVVAGPYWVPSGQIFVGGAVAGDIQ